MKRVLDRAVFTDFNLRSEFTANSRSLKMVLMKFTARPHLCAIMCEKKQAVNLGVHQDGGRPRSRIPEILETEAMIADERFP
jgi:hypothetical protein